MSIYKKVFLTSIIVSEVIIIFLLSYFLILRNHSSQLDKTALLYEKVDAWGPCPPFSKCTSTIQLYYSGKIISDNNFLKEKELDQQTVQNIVRKINSSGLMKKDCLANPVIDYSAYYRIIIANKEKKINFPGCEKELTEIDKLIAGN
ncbi:MAG: hypothetical protein WCJ58_08915 [bacterium]